MSFSQSFCGHILYDLIFPAMSQEVELRSPKSIGAPCKPKDEESQGPHKRYLSDATDATKHFLEEKMASGFCEVCMVRHLPLPPLSFLSVSSIVLDLPRRESNPPLHRHTHTTYHSQQSPLLSSLFPSTNKPLTIRNNRRYCLHSPRPQTNKNNLCDLTSTAREAHASERQQERVCHHHGHRLPLVLGGLLCQRSKQLPHGHREDG